jgi:antitoxin (DNA-binding transcriptional repressor) of toxin-antitoxin stability system
MLRISVEEPVINLKVLLEQVAKGEEVILIEQDKAVDRLVPVQQKKQWLDNMTKFQDSLAVQR